MEGNFTKLIYSTPHFTMNGLFVTAPLLLHQPSISNVSTEGAIASFRCVENDRSKKSISFHPYIPDNLKIIQEFSRIEYRILEYYKQIYHRSQKISNVLSKQLYSGAMKVYKDKSYIGSTSQQGLHEFDIENALCDITDTTINNQKYVIKISGIWETSTDIGLTFKLLAIQDTIL